jgi:hypothetical protein
MGLITRRPQFIVDLHAAWAFIASDISNGCKRMHSSESIRGVVVWAHGAPTDTTQCGTTLKWPAAFSQIDPDLGAVGS